MIGFSVKRIWPCLFAILAAAPAYADAVEPGQYVFEGANGTLTVKAGGFTIDTLGGNGHSCGLEGRLSGLKGETKGDGGDICRITFTRISGGWRAKAETGESCRSFCGMRADFQGAYLTPPQGCAAGEQARTRKHFKSLYDAKAYAEAAPLLQGLLKSCDGFVSWLELGWIRNDLALTRYRLGDAKGCGETLKPLADDAALSDDAYREKFPPTDAENYLPIVKAARANLALCKGK